MLKDRETLNRLHRGDHNALREMYERHKHRLLATATCLLGDTEAAEDCLHDVFVAIAERAPVLRVRGKLDAYLTTSIANRARDVLRKRARRTVPIADTPDPVSPSADPVAATADCERTERLVKALSELPYEQREVITLHLQGGLTFKRIARMQGRSINTVQSRYRYGIDKLRELLTEGVRT